MSIIADRLVDKKIVFVLAQKPHIFDGESRIATLVPIMDFENGAAISADKNSFPSFGYVRWYKVPPGHWSDGDIVIGTLKRNENNGYGIAETEWYQIYGDGGDRSNGRLVEIVDTQLATSEMRKLIGRELQLDHVPKSDFYLSFLDSIAGPFKARSSLHMQSNLATIDAADAVDGRIGVYDRVAFEKNCGACISVDALLSSSDFRPTSRLAESYRSKFRLLRKQDLEKAHLRPEVHFLLSDEQIVAKACKQLSHGKSWKTLRDELKSLVKLLNDSSPELSQAVVEGLPHVLARAELQTAWTEEIAKSILGDDRFKQRIDDAIAAKTEDQIRSRADEIEAQAKLKANSKLGELDSINLEVESRQNAKTLLEVELKELEESKAKQELYLAEIVTGATKRLENARNEIVGELALLAPLFQANQASMVDRKGPHLQESMCYKVNADCSEANLESTPILQSASINEQEFLDGRLYPCLLNYGCELSKRDAEFFHTSMVSGRLISVPHPGWVAGYAEAMGGTAKFQTITVSPDWLKFESAFSGQLAKTWRNAISDPRHLSLIVLEGFDRCPSHAWFRPWLNILAGWNSNLPDLDSSSWPDNIRLSVSYERSSECFAVPNELRDWILDFQPRETADAVPALLTGHFSFETWKLQESLTKEDEFDGFLKELDLPLAMPFIRMRRELASRMRITLRRLDDQRNDANCSAIIARRLFSCWSPEASQ